MAFTFTLIKQNVIGNQRAVQYNVSCDASGSGAVGTPMGYIDAAFISPISMNSSTSPAIKINTKAASAAGNGSIFVSTPTSGDNFFLMVYGRG